MVNYELSLFKKNTDAIATNRGFLYQYLKTLNTWIRNYIEGNNVEIYCETEDDIKELDLINSIVRFTQVKCYSTSFSLKSEDIKKSIFNFFILYSEYSCKYSGEFQFITNSKVSRESVLLDKWALSDGDLDKELLEELILESRKIIEEFITKEKDAQIKKFDEMILKRNNKITSDDPNSERIQRSISELESKKGNIRTQYKIAMEYVQDDVKLKDFISKIKWEFDDISAEESIEVLKTENIELISKIKEIECVSKTMEARLLTEVFHKSSESLVENRVLTNNLFAEIIRESEDEIYQKADGVLVQIYYRFDSLEDKMNTILESLKDKENEKMVSKKQEIDKINLKFFEEDEIERVKVGGEEEREKQSNLERKISNIGLGQDAEFLIDIATTNRCSYLLYLEELKLTGRTNEYQVIKELERKVRSHCFNQFRKKQAKIDFNPHDFWLDLQEELTKESKIFEKSKQIEIDDEIVFAQMYQIAAECPLKWHKE
ncbi:hypothetical protein bmyco0003_19710 [Bacillus pseudomycoides]|uniref:dsDNA nuclease domain-containing protein n=1 Tax=Bacillus TaxID=1386 RepID=UPI0001A14CD5|nr:MULTISPECIES: dsDNA nuclease domain-containing protein [Bacillus]EEM11276.1 hypothetical protein bmyco0003_19710 [Bacillus pseudomycoides]PGC30281.1 hypothetical protein COM18_28845 [Bacillus pseudomycoides]